MPFFLAKWRVRATLRGVSDPALLVGAVLAWPLLAALGFVLAGNRLGRGAAVLGPLVPLAALAGVITLSLSLPGGSQTVLLVEWIPQLEIRLDFLLDGLSLFYALVVTGVGVLIFFYAACYFGPADPRLPRFFACLSLFMGAMLGTVLSNNLLVLFIFWELTGIASFLLIGFDHHKEASRAGARMALLVTMTTGLCFLVGAVMVGAAYETFDLAEIISRAPVEGPGPVWMTAALVLVALGAFGKSAQFPFHFWLPNAMAAPTPVSAYLHSATMVKLGVFLVARFFPVFQDHALWFPLLAGMSFSTMLLGAWFAFRSTDLKAILAHSTVSMLGFLIGFYGLGASIGLRFDFVHITNHVIYKACLFMVVGVVDHATGIRDIRQLGGLRRRLPVLAAAAALGCAAMAGVPGTLGFISKEIILADMIRTFGVHPVGGPVLVGLVLTASLFSVAFAARLFFHIFCGPEPDGVKAHYHDPGRWIQLPPVLLAAATLVLGLFPALAEKPLAALRFASLHAPGGGYLKLWHGFNLELAMSAGLVLGGAGLYAWHQRIDWPGGIPRWLRWDAGFEWLVKAVPQGGGALSRLLRADRPLDYLPILLLFVLLTAGAVVFTPGGGDLVVAWEGAWTQAEPAALRVFAASVIAVAAVLAVVLRGWMAQLISLSVVGLFTTFYYVLYRAPDLALTQILVESATLLGVLLLLARFPRAAEAGERERQPGRARQAFHLVLAAGCGFLAASLVALAVVFRHRDMTGYDFLAATVPLAKGTNAVNTILIDFRGFDTLGEITVLLIAVLGGVGLVMRYRRTPEEWTAGEKGPAGFGIPRSAEGKEGA